MRKIFDVLFLFCFENTTSFCSEFILVKYLSKLSKFKYFLARQSAFYTHPSAIVLENVDAIKKRPWY